MQNKTAYTDFILTELNKGNVQYKEVCSVFCSKFHLTERTFNSYWIKANKAYQEQRTEINKAKLEDSINQEIKAVKDAEYYRNKILAKMEEILDQKAKRVEGQVVMPSYSDTIRASERIAKITGLDAPKEVEQNHTIKIERVVSK